MTKSLFNWHFGESHGNILFPVSSHIYRFFCTFFKYLGHKNDWQWHLFACGFDCCSFVFVSRAITMLIVTTFTEMVKIELYLYILYLGMFVQKLFYFCWINVFSSADDHILQNKRKSKSHFKNSATPAWESSRTSLAHLSVPGLFQLRKTLKIFKCLPRFLQDCGSYKDLRRSLICWGTYKDLWKDHSKIPGNQGFDEDFTRISKTALHSCKILENYCRNVKDRAQDPVRTLKIFGDWKWRSSKILERFSPMYSVWVIVACN